MLVIIVQSVWRETMVESYRGQLYPEAFLMSLHQGNIVATRSHRLHVP